MILVIIEAPTVPSGSMHTYRHTLTNQNHLLVGSSYKTYIEFTGTYQKWLLLVAVH